MADIPTLSEYIQRRKGPCCPRCGRASFVHVHIPAEHRRFGAPSAFAICGLRGVGGCAHLFTADWCGDGVHRDLNAEEKTWIKKNAESEQLLKAAQQRIFDREGLHG